jgi:hypothetical protein
MTEDLGKKRLRGGHHLPVKISRKKQVKVELALKDHPAFPVSAT